MISFALGLVAAVLLAMCGSALVALGAALQDVWKYQDRIDRGEFD